MKYFEVLQNVRGSNYAHIIGLIDFTHFNRIISGETHLLPDTSVFSLQTNYADFPPILTKQLFMVSEDIFDIFRLFGFGKKYKTSFVINELSSRHHFYYIPTVETLEFSSEKTEEGSGIITLNQNRSFPDVFRVQTGNHNKIVMSLPIIEAILRRNSDALRIHSLVHEGHKD